MELKEIDNKGLTEFFLSDPKLTCMALSDEELVNLYETKQYERFPGATYLQAIDNNECIAILQLEPFTKYSVTLHARLRTEHQGTGKVIELFEEIKNYLLNMQITTIISFAPESCYHASKCLIKLGFKEKCILEKSIVWRKNLEDLKMYSYLLKESI